MLFFPSLQSYISFRPFRTDQTGHWRIVWRFIIPIIMSRCFKLRVYSPIRYQPIKPFAIVDQIRAAWCCYNTRDSSFVDIGMDHPSSHHSPVRWLLLKTNRFSFFFFLSKKKNWLIKRRERARTGNQRRHRVGCLIKFFLLADNSRPDRPSSIELDRQEEGGRPPTVGNTSWASPTKKTAKSRYFSL